jgi:hypothetical protein
MDKQLQEFEDARANRALRTDYDGHVTTKDRKGNVVVDMENSKHRERTRHEGTAADLARAYVAAHPELEGRYGRFGRERLVQLVDSARDRGDPETVAEIDAWLMAKFAPQHIGATVFKVVDPS